MRLNFKAIMAALLCFSVVVGTGFYTFMNSEDSNASVTLNPSGPLVKETTLTESDRKDLPSMTRKSARVNVLLTGSDGGRSDTMMVLSYDPGRKLVDIISFPRDTRVETVDSTGKQKVGKLNATYNFDKQGAGGPENVQKAISKIAGIPIHYYVDVDYNAVREIVNILGGIEVDIPFAMKYDDPYCDPPLHINLKPGKQVLNGDKAIQFLRWRKNNTGIQQGDIQRIERQHAFVKTAFKKAFGFKLPEEIQAALKYIKTDMPIDKMLYYAGTSIGLDTAKIRSYRLPGDAEMIDETSYFVYDPVDAGRMMLAIYNRTGSEAPVNGTITEMHQIDPSIPEKQPKGPSNTVSSPVKESATTVKKSGVPKTIKKAPALTLKKHPVGDAQTAQ